MNDYEKAFVEESEKLLGVLGGLRDALKELNTAQLELAKNMQQVIVSLSDNTQNHGDQ